jgi:hypothetical protein
MTPALQMIAILALPQIGLASNRPPHLLENRTLTLAPLGIAAQRLVAAAPSEPTEGIHWAVAEEPPGLGAALALMIAGSVLLAGGGFVTVIGITVIAQGGFREAPAGTGLIISTATLGGLMFAGGGASMLVLGIHKYRRRSELLDARNFSAFVNPATKSAVVRYRFSF